MIKKCKQCEAEFKVRPSHFDKKTYCSRACMSKSYKSEMIGTSNPNFKGVLSVKKFCLICGEEFSDTYRKSKILCGKRDCITKNSSAKLMGRKRPAYVIQQRLTTLKLNNMSREVPFIEKKTNQKTKKTPVKIKFISTRIIKHKSFCKCGRLVNIPENTKCFKCLRESKAVFTNCTQCNSIIKKRHTNHKFCNKECLRQHKIDNNYGNNNPNWKGGVKPINQIERNHVAYKTWRISVFERDKYTCQDCGQIGGKLNAHHIKSFSKFKELRTNLANGKTLCKICHSKYHPTLSKLIVQHL